MKLTTQFAFINNIYRKIKFVEKAHIFYILIQDMNRLQVTLESIQPCSIYNLSTFSFIYNII